MMQVYNKYKNKFGTSTIRLHIDMTKNVIKVFGMSVYV